MDANLSPNWGIDCYQSYRENVLHRAQRARGAAQGYLIDHVKALACGGADATGSVQWQTEVDTKVKDKWERKYAKTTTYHQRYTMVNLILVKEAEDELDALYDIDEAAAALIDFLLERLLDDDDMLDRLCSPKNHYTYTPPFEIKRYGEMQNLGKNIYTLKIRDEQGALLPYRVLIGYHAQINTYYVLSVPNRDIAYDTTDKVFQDVLDRYGSAGIPDYPHWK